MDEKNEPLPVPFIFDQGWPGYFVPPCSPPDCIDLGVPEQEMIPAGLMVDLDYLRRYVVPDGCSIVLDDAEPEPEPKAESWRDREPML